MKLNQALIVAMLGACGERVVYVQAPAAIPPSVSPDPEKPQPRWWCYRDMAPSGPSDCERSIRACETFRAKMVARNPEFSPTACVGEIVAVCFRWKDPELPEGSSCSVTMPDCENHQRVAIETEPRARITSACAVTE